MMHHAIGLQNHCVGVGPISRTERLLVRRALAAIKGELVNVDAQVDQLVKDMNRSIAEADKLIHSMEREPA